MKEFEYIDWIRGHAPGAGRRDVLVGPGDDCAVLRFDGQLLITTDQCLDGVHFKLDVCGPRLAGRKIFARSLSDIAAMAGTPVAAVATAALPGAMAHGAIDAFQRELYAGLSDLCEPFDCPIIGGDLSFGAPALHLTVTMFGRADDSGPVLRSGAKVGDAILVTGALGRAWQSGRDLRFTPRVVEALALARMEGCRPTAMIDISDGPAGDLGHLCRESGLGARVWAERLPISEAAAACDDPVAAALTDGEDYELLFTADPAAAERIVRDKPFDAPVTIIGEMRPASEGVILAAPTGEARPLRHLASYEHGN